MKLKILLQFKSVISIVFLSLSCQVENENSAINSNQNISEVAPFKGVFNKWLSDATQDLYIDLDEYNRLKELIKLKKPNVKEFTSYVYNLPIEVYGMYIYQKGETLEQNIKNKDLLPYMDVMKSAYNSSFGDNVFDISEFLNSDPIVEVKSARDRCGGQKDVYKIEGNIEGKKFVFKANYAYNHRGCEDSEDSSILYKTLINNIPVKISGNNLQKTLELIVLENILSRSEKGLLPLSLGESRKILDGDKNEVKIDEKNYIRILPECMLLLEALGFTNEQNGDRYPSMNEM